MPISGYFPSPSRLTETILAILQRDTWRPSRCRQGRRGRRRALRHPTGAAVSLATGRAMDVQPRLHLGFARSEARRPARVANVRAKAVRRSSPMIRLPM